MVTNLVNRIARLVKADAHGVVDVLEDKALLLKQHVREAELDLLQKCARLEALGQEGERLAEEAKRRQEELDALDADVRLALEGDEEDLARFSIRKLIPARRELDGCLRAGAEVGDAKGRLEQVVATQETQLLELKQRARARMAELAREPADADAVFGPLVSDEEVELELLRRRRAAAASEVG